MKIGKLIIVGLLILGLYCIGSGTGIYAKALIAQVLLERSWQQSTHALSIDHRRENTDPTDTLLAPRFKPWPWADTWPVARLYVPRLGREQIVLAGVSGEALAFGPGHMNRTAAPGSAGNSVIAGHRDTHFRWLEKLVLGDLVVIERPDRMLVEYEIHSLKVVDEHALEVTAPEIGTHITLLTCYPFDAVNPGGTLRYIVKGMQVGVAKADTKRVEMPQTGAVHRQFLSTAL